MSADVLPNVQPTEFEFVDGNLYYLPPEGGPYRVTQATIVANMPALNVRARQLFRHFPIQVRLDQRKEFL